MADRFGTFRALVQIDLAYCGQGPVLVRAGGAAPPELPDMSFVRYPTDAGAAPFLPGSSIKGVLRTGVEQVLRARDEPVCNVLDNKEKCKAPEQRCAACLLFGSTMGAGVLMVDDAMPWRPEETPEKRCEKLRWLEKRTVVRHGVGIDRATGAAKSGVLYDFEALVSPTFFGSLRLRNPTIEQLQLTATAVLMLREDLLRIGGMTSRGLGRVVPRARRLTVRAATAAVAEPILATGDFGAPVSSGLLSEWVAGGPDADPRRRGTEAERVLAAWAQGQAARETTP